MNFNLSADLTNKIEGCDNSQYDFFKHGDCQGNSICAVELPDRVSVFDHDEFYQFALKVNRISNNNEPQFALFKKEVAQLNKASSFDSYATGLLAKTAMPLVAVVAGFTIMSFGPAMSLPMAALLGGVLGSSGNFIGEATKQFIAHKLNLPELLYAGFSGFETGASSALTAVLLEEAVELTALGSAFSFGAKLITGNFSSINPLANAFISSGMQVGQGLLFRKLSGEEILLDDVLSDALTGFSTGFASSRLLQISGAGRRIVATRNEQHTLQSVTTEIPSWPTNRQPDIRIPEPARRSDTAVFGKDLWESTPTRTQAVPAKPVDPQREELIERALGKRVPDRGYYPASDPTQADIAQRKAVVARGKPAWEQNEIKNGGKKR